jgi:hypothetical protein
VPWPHDGRSLFGQGHSPRVDFLTDRGLAQANVSELIRDRNRTVREKAQLFGRGILDLGPHPELRGRPVAELRVDAGAAQATVDPDVRRLLDELPTGADVVPAQVMGSIRGPGAAADRPLALALNGRIAATTRTYSEGSTIRYSAMAPESALHPGRNQVELYWITEDRDGLQLERLGR